MSLEGAIRITKGETVSWAYHPATFGIWSGHIVNNKLKSLVVDVYDVTTGVAESVSHQRIWFAHPFETVDTQGVIMSPVHTYEIVVEPGIFPIGPKDAYCTVDDVFTY